MENQTNIDYSKAIANYEKQHKIAIAYGGDGTVLDVVRKTNGKKSIIPIRNYGLCEEHQGMLQKILDGTYDKDLKLTLCPFIRYDFANGTSSEKGIAEVTVKNIDPTSALRFNLHVNKKCYMKNVIADGVVFSTSYGSTGYFKSVARCIFNIDAIGVAFIAPTQGVNNLILDCAQAIDLEFVRSADIVVTADKYKDKIHVSPYDRISIERMSEQVSIFGLEEFHCQQCRALRHSSYENGQEIQDMYVK